MRDAGAREVGVLLPERVAHRDPRDQGDERRGQRVGEQRHRGTGLEIGAAHPVHVQPQRYRRHNVLGRRAYIDVQLGRVVGARAAGGRSRAAKRVADSPERRLKQSERPVRLAPVVQLGEPRLARAEIRQVVGPGGTELVARPGARREEPAARLRTQEPFWLGDPAVGARDAAPHVRRGQRGVEAGVHLGVRVGRQPERLQHDRGGEPHHCDVTASFTPSPSCWW